MKYYIAYVVGCTDPEVRGPFDTNFQRNEAALALKKDEADEEDGIFALDVNDDGEPALWPYSGKFMEDGLIRLKITELMHLNDLDASDLDELVDETVSRCGCEQPAHTINNGGIVEQLDFLLDAGVEEEAIMAHLGLEGPA